MSASYSYYVNLNPGPGAGSIVRAFNYSAITKKLTAVSSRCTWEEDETGFAMLLDGDYVMICDGDGLLVGDVYSRFSPSYPRLEWVALTCGIRQTMAKLSREGALEVPSFTESDTLPGTGMNLLDKVEFGLSGAVTTKVNEAWLLTSDGNYLCVDGQVIVVRP